MAEEIVFLVLFGLGLLYGLLVLFWDDANKGDHWWGGFISAICTIVIVTVALNMYARNHPSSYYNGEYSVEIKDIEKYRIDSTFTTTGNRTDTTFTLYYKSIPKDDKH